LILLFLASLAQAPAACPAEQTYEAHVCRALSSSSSGDHATAAHAFERAAAEAKNELERERAWAAAGNLWIAANQPGKAALALDRALAGTTLQAEQRGEALLDRARAAEAQNDLATARARVDQAAATISEDPFLWYFSAALAIREGNKERAQSAINRALALVPTDPTVQFEAGHVAHFVGDAEKARHYWSEAQRLDPEGAVGKAAKEALAMSAAPVTVKTP
jgi:tetratricopeptide (TPR) repeat protein